MRTGRKFKSFVLLSVGTFLLVLCLYFVKTDNSNSWRKFKVQSLTSGKGSRNQASEKRTEHNLLVLKDKIPKKTIYEKNRAIAGQLVDFTSIVEQYNVNITRFGDVTNSSTGSSVTDALLDTVVGRQEDVQEHKMRLSNLHHKCASRASIGCKNIDQCNLTEFFHSKQYNFAYCKVPKSGSTFWMKLFLVLHNGERYMKLVNRWSRSDIHARSRRLLTPPSKIYREKIATIVVSRNPYSRLFSAYTDKVFMPLFWGQFKSMNSVRFREPFSVNRTVYAFKKSNSPLPERFLVYQEQMLKKGLLKQINATIKVLPVCANDASFEDFLQFIIAEVKLGHRLEPHWAPISSLCRPCLFNTQTIVKQESFARDVEYTLSSFNINTTGLHELKKELLDTRVENSIPGIVGVVERKALLPDVKLCISNKDIVKRLWKAFQIQGYISDKAELPKELLSGKFEKHKIISKALVSLKKDKLTAEQRSNQRQSYLTKAYSSISSEIIKEIQAIFRSDFELFDYSLEPPK